jgi:hypothetical protein
MSNEQKAQEEGKTSPLNNKEINELLTKVNTLMNSPLIGLINSKSGQEGIGLAAINALRAAGRHEEADLLMNNGVAPTKGAADFVIKPITNFLNTPQTGASLLKAGGVAVGVAAVYDFTAARMEWDIPRPGYFQGGEEEMAPTKKSR